MPNSDGSLTSKEQKVVDEFESASSGYGAIAEQNIRNLNTGWAVTIADMDESEIVCMALTASNSFIYRHIS